MLNLIVKSREGKKKEPFSSNQLRKKIKLFDGRWTSVTISPEYLEAIDQNVLNVNWEDIAYGLNPMDSLSKGMSLARFIKTEIVKELIRTIKLSNELKMAPYEVRKLLKKES